MDNVLHVIGMIFGVVLAIISLVVSIYLIRNRKQFPTKGRILPAVLVAIWSIPICIITASILRLKQLRCHYWSQVLIGVSISGVFETYFVRFFSLWYSYKLTQEQLSYAEVRRQASASRYSKAPETPETDSRDTQKSFDIGHMPLGKDSQIIPRKMYFVRYQFLNKRSILNAVLAVLIFIRLILNIVLFKDTTDTDAQECPQNPTVNVALQTWNMIYMVIFIACAFSLRKLRDNMKIKSEMIQFSIWVFVVTLLSTVIYPQINAPTTVTVIHWIDLCVPVVISGIIPALHARKYLRDVRDFDPSEFASLSQQLSTPEGYASFSEYLKKEFSLENLMFYRIVEDFRQHFISRTRKQNTKFASFVYAFFLSAASPLQVNISAENKTEVFDKLGVRESLEFRTGTTSAVEKLVGFVDSQIQTDIDLFDSCQREVLHLMEGDSYIRYRLEREQSLDASGPITNV